MPERSNSFVLSPSLSLVRKLLVFALRSREGHHSSSCFSLVALISIIDTTYVSMLDHRRQMFIGWANAMLALQAIGELTVSVIGDAPILFMHSRAISHVTFMPSFFTGS